MLVTFQDRAHLNQWRFMGDRHPEARAATLVFERICKESQARNAWIDEQYKIACRRRGSHAVCRSMFYEAAEQKFPYTVWPCSVEVE
jgi:hypothetical protein